MLVAQRPLPGRKKDAEDEEDEGGRREQQLQMREDLVPAHGTVLPDIGCSDLAIGTSWISPGSCSQHTPVTPLALPGNRRSWR